MTRAVRLEGIAFLAFVSLGLPDGVLGVAWPSMREALGLHMGELGGLLAAAMAGSVVSAFASGRSRRGWASEASCSHRAS